MTQHQYNVLLGILLWVVFTPVVWLIWFCFFRETEKPQKKNKKK